MSSPELSPPRDIDRSRSRSAPMEEEANGRSRSPIGRSRSSPLADDRSPAPRRDDSRSPARSPRDIEPSPVRRSPSLERGRDRSRTPVRRTHTRSRSRPIRERSLARADSRDPPPRKRSLSREPRKRSPSREYRRRSPSREYRRRSPSPYRDRRARSPPARDYYRRSPPPRRAYSPYGGRRRSPPRRGFSPPRFRGGGGGGGGRRATPPARGLHMFVAGLNFITNEREVEEKRILLCACRTGKPVQLGAIYLLDQKLGDYDNAAAVTVSQRHCREIDHELEDRFNRYGPVREARIVRNPRTGESRGFGFVMMEAEEDVDQAIRHLDGRDWNGRRLLVERARNVK